jgi:hypothetical protein
MYLNIKRSPLLLVRIPPSPRTDSVTKIPRTDGGQTIPVGWNCKNSISTKLAPAFKASAWPSPVPSHEFEVILNVFPTPPVAMITAGASAYPRIIDWWKKLDALTPQVRMETRGTTDASFPLHLAVISTDGKTDWSSIKKSGKRIMLINNGIHPGEPDGIDASMLLARDIITRKIDLPNNVVLAIIPVYNIGGALNRSENYRVDQNGPDAFGSRGNSQNLDLNRDFIKCDSKEALAFTRLFRDIDPDVFIDNHVSNGADYQHVMTLLTTQFDKLGGAMGDFLRTKFEPAIYAHMKNKGYDLVPYVNSYGDKPEAGWPLYWDGPR